MCYESLPPVDPRSGSWKGSDDDDDTGDNGGDSSACGDLPGRKGATAKAKGQRSKRHTPEQIVVKLRDADAMLNAGKDVAAVLQSLGVSEATLHRWRAQYGGMKSEEAKRLKQLEDENRRLKQLVAD